MLSVNSYSQAYVEASRAKIAAQMSAYAVLIAAIRERAPGRGLDARIAAFDRQFFNNLALALDHYFDHRSRTLEGKDGNPLNELRVICNSLTQGDGKLVADKSIRLRPATSVTGLAPGDDLALDEPTFMRLADAVFDAVARRYP